MSNHVRIKNTCALRTRAAISKVNSVFDSTHGWEVTASQRERERERGVFHRRTFIFESFFVFFSHVRRYFHIQTEKRDDSHAEEVIFRWKMLRPNSSRGSMWHIPVWPFFILLQKQEFVSSVVTIMLSHAVIYVTYCRNSTNVPILLTVYIRRKSLHDETKHSRLMMSHHRLCMLAASDQTKEGFFFFFLWLFCFKEISVIQVCVSKPPDLWGCFQKHCEINDYVSVLTQSQWPLFWNPISMKNVERWYSAWWRPTRDCFPAALLLFS